MEIDISDPIFEEEKLSKALMKYRDIFRFRLLIAEYNQISDKNLSCFVSHYKLKIMAKNSQKKDISYSIDGLIIKG